MHDKTAEQVHQQLIMHGEITDQDDGGANFFLGTDGENAPADEDSNYRLSSQMDGQDPYMRPSKLLQNDEDGQYEALQKQIQDSLNCDFQSSQNQQFQFLDHKGNM